MNLRAPILIADTSTLLNLYASDRFEDILTAIAIPVSIAENVVNESRYILRNGQKEMIDLQPYISKGLLLVVTFESEEEESTFIQFSQDIDDGESATGAIAYHRKWDIATEDIKARTIFARDIPDCVCVGTPDIIKHTAEFFKWEDDILRMLIQTIYIQSRFRPQKNTTLAEWWNGYM